MTKEPLVEEYSVAAQVWKLSAADLCGIARNSVLNSDFPHVDKQHWVSETYWRPGPAGNDIKRTNVPNIRVQFRHDVLEAEKRLIRRASSKPRPRDASCTSREKKKRSRRAEAAESRRGVRERGRTRLTRASESRHTRSRRQ